MSNISSASSPAINPSTVANTSASQELQQTVNALENQSTLLQAAIQSELQHEQFEQRLAADAANFQSFQQANAPSGSSSADAGISSTSQDTIGNIGQNNSPLSQMVYQELNLLSVLSELVREENNSSTASAQSPVQQLINAANDASAMYANNATGNNYNELAGANTFSVSSSGSGSISVNVDGQQSHTTLQQSNNSLVNLNESVAGGYNVSTVSGKDSQGKTRNVSASVQLDNNHTITSKLDENGKHRVTISDSSGVHNLRIGKTEKIGQNESATLNMNGTLTIKADGYNNAKITTHIISHGTGFNVDTSGTNSFVGGYAGTQAVDHQQQLQK